MKEYNPDPAVKKAKYIASIIYLLVLAFLVGGSYINQQQETPVNDINFVAEKDIIRTEAKE
jgi:hypothetical protein